MKTIAVSIFLCVLPFAFIQATSSVPTTETPQQLQAKALKLCIEQQKADPNEIKEIFKKDILPEDDLKFTEFFACYWKAANVITPDDAFNHFQIKILYPDLIRERYPKLTEEQSIKLAVGAVDSCQGVPKGNSIGLKGIQYRNCLTKYVLSKQ